MLIIKRQRIKPNKLIYSLIIKQQQQQQQIKYSTNQSHSINLTNIIKKTSNFSSSYSYSSSSTKRLDEQKRIDSNFKDEEKVSKEKKFSIGFHPLKPFKVLDNSSPSNNLSIITDGSGNVLDLDQFENKDFSIKVYELMVGLPLFDTTMNNLQRHGRISFYMTSYGEEGAVVGSAAAWDPKDEIFAQYREQGVLLWRGCGLDFLTSQCFSTALDKSSKGRQMPVHYGSRDFHFYPISSPLATQIPQASGAAYALKRLKQNGQRKDGCVICYLGEGAASEGDFHAGVNMASVLGGPIIFFVRNNGFAISTPANQQFRGDGINSRAAGYGIDAIRVDGNDPIAVYLASKEARRRATEGSGRAIMVEAMTYRVGHHSTSDDSSAYRNPDDVEQWRKRDNPIHRMRKFLESRGWWEQVDEDKLKDKWKDEIKRSVKFAEKTPKPPLSEMWTDTYAPRKLNKKKEEDENERGKGLNNDNNKNNEDDEEGLGLEDHLSEQKLESEFLLDKFKDYKGYREELLKFSKPTKTKQIKKNDGIN